MDKSRIRIKYKEKKRRKSGEERKVEEHVFDLSTLETLYELSKKGIIKALGGPISTGKEAVIFSAIGKEEEEIAIKIYKISTSNFKAMLDYIIGDKRFENIKKDHRSIIFAWAHKEFINLKKAFECGVNVPKPIACEKNVLVMEFIGERGIAAPKLKDLPLKELNIDIKKLFLCILSYMQILYNDAKIVHADLSEYNILIDFLKEKSLPSPSLSPTPIIIDMGQSVLIDHPNAEEFLRRDVRNISQFFNKFGLGLDWEEEEIINRIKVDGRGGKGKKEGGKEVRKKK